MNREQTFASLTHDDANVAGLTITMSPRLRRVRICRTKLGFCGHDLSGC